MTPQAYPEIFSMKIFTRGNIKGMLLVEETLKMILAVIAIGFLIYILVSIYFAKVQGNELIAANANIELIRKNILNLSENQIVLNNPVGWNLFSFVDGEKPNACAEENCLCICDEVLVDSFILFDTNRQFDECNEDGACLGISNLQKFNPIEIKKLTKILIKKSDGKVEVIEK
jgi:hypothetical protein